jgi:glycosyltransferase involved in cell wall biosynthesis
LLSVFATFGVGGPQVRFAAVANRFANHYRHMIVAMDGVTTARERLSPDLDISFPAVENCKGATLRNRRNFRAALWKWRPDVLVTSNWGSLEWAMANFPPVCQHIHTEDGFGPEEQHAQLRRRVLTRRLVLARSTVVVPSRNLERIATDVWGLSPRRVIYIPNGIGLTRFTGAPNVSRVSRDELVIGAVAGLRPEKNFGRLLHAVRAVAAEFPVQLTLVGDGPERPALERLAADLDISERVQFIGHIADPAPLYQTFDLFALSSDTEQMPISVIEAMAAGLAVAGTDVGDVRTMLAAQNAPFIGPIDTGALARSLITLLGDAELRRRVGAANRARAVRDYDQENMFEAYRALFDGRK